jgi:hypothetical protein
MKLNSAQTETASWRACSSQPAAKTSCVRGRDLGRLGGELAEVPQQGSHRFVDVGALEVGQERGEEALVDAERLCCGLVDAGSSRPPAEGPSTTPGQVEADPAEESVSALEDRFDTRPTEPLIVPDEIRSGRPPPDGIPSIAEPASEPAKTVTWLRWRSPTARCATPGLSSCARWRPGPVLRHLRDALCRQPRDVRPADRVPVAPAHRAGLQPRHRADRPRLAVVVINLDGPGPRDEARS